MSLAFLLIHVVVCIQKDNDWDLLKEYRKEGSSVRFRTQSSSLSSMAVLAQKQNYVCVFIQAYASLACIGERDYIGI